MSRCHQNWPRRTHWTELIVKWRGYCTGATLFLVTGRRTDDEPAKMTLRRARASIESSGAPRRGRLPDGASLGHSAAWPSVHRQFVSIARCTCNFSRNWILQPAPNQTVLYIAIIACHSFLDFVSLVGQYTPQRRDVSWGLCTASHFYARWN